MTRLGNPPFRDGPVDKKQNWTSSWFEWMRDVWNKTNERKAVVGDTTEDNFVKFNSDGDLVDSDKAVPTGDVVGTTDTQTITNKTADYLVLTGDPTNELHAVNIKYANKNYLRDVPISEAGEEEGARPGSYRIGLSDDGYAFFDADGTLMLYGTAGLQIMVPVNLSTASKFAVFDSDGNLKYETQNQLAVDLNVAPTSSPTFVDITITGRFNMSDLEGMIYYQRSV